MKELTERQETRLITHLESSFTTLHRHFETRHSPLSTLPTLHQYLETLTSLHSIILSIPPVGSSAALRTAFHLQLISLLPSALSAYPLLPPSNYLWSALKEFDEGLVKVLNGDSAVGGVRAAETGVRGTDRVRMESVVLDVKKVLRSALGVSSNDNREVDFRGEVVVPSMLVAVATSTSTSSTPALTDDLSMDSVEEDSSSDEEEDDSEFEEVDVVDNELQNEDEAELFSIHYEAPTTTVETATSTEEEQDIRPGFDPDEEYPDEEGTRMDTDTDSDEAISKHVEKVFELALARLDQFKLPLQEDQ